MTTATNSATRFARGELTDRALEFTVIIQDRFASAEGLDALPDDYWDAVKERIDVANYRRCSQDLNLTVDIESLQEEFGIDGSPMMSDMLDWEAWRKTLGDAVALGGHLWEGTVMRAAEWTIPGLPAFVYLELEERSAARGQLEDVGWSNTILLFEFNSDGKITILRIGLADTGLRSWPVSYPSSGFSAMQA